MHQRVLTSCGARGRDGSAPPRPHSRGRSERRVVVELATPAGAVAGLAGTLRGGGGPLEAGADLLGLDLDHAAALALGGLPGAGLEPSEDDDAVALGQRVGGVGGQVPPDVDAEERGLSVLPALPVLDAGGDGQPEAADLSTAGGEPDFGVVGEVADQRDIG